jgi:ABC-type transport system substrate-binding protein
MNKALAVLFFSLISTLPQSGHGGATPTPKQGGVLRFGLFRDIVKLNPFDRTLSVNRDVGSIAFECLLTMDEKGDFKPALATSSDVSSDGRRYTFNLRKGAQFQMTSGDVIRRLRAVRPGDSHQETGDQRSAAQVCRYLGLPVPGFQCWTPHSTI